MVKTIYKYIQALSLDVAFGSTVMSAFIAEFLNIYVPLEVFVSLFIAVWLIYTIDHLIDAKNLKTEAKTFRHLLHQKHFKKLTSIWIFMLLFGVIFSVLFLPLATIKAGFVASALVIIHLVLVYLLGSKVSIFIQKELGVAFTYCVGIALGPVSLSEELNGFSFFFLGQIFLLVLINLLEFSWFDREVDKTQGQTSIVRNLGERFVLDVIFFLFTMFALSVIIMFLVFPAYGNFQIMLCVMALVLFIVFVFQGTFKSESRYRIFGDMVFLFPFLLLI